jgi:hypothetical protein
MASKPAGPLRASVHTVSHNTNIAQIQNPPLQWQIVRAPSISIDCIETPCIATVSLSKAISPAARWAEREPSQTSSHRQLLLSCFSFAFIFLLVLCASLITTWRPEPCGTTNCPLRRYRGRPLCRRWAASGLFCVTAFCVLTVITSVLQVETLWCVLCRGCNGKQRLPSPKF